MPSKPKEVRKEKPTKVIGYSRRTGSSYIYVAKTHSPDIVMVSTSRGWPQVWMAEIKNIDFVNPLMQ